MCRVAQHESRPVQDRVALGGPIGILDAQRGEDERIALPLANRVTRVSGPPVVRTGVGTSIGIDSQDVWAVLRENPRLFGTHHELVHVRQVHDPGKPGRGPADNNRVWKLALVPQLQISMVDGFPLRVVGRALPESLR